MTLLSKEYLLLFNAVTDAERTLSQLRESLLEAQRQAEELFFGKYALGRSARRSRGRSIDPGQNPLTSRQY